VLIATRDHPAAEAGDNARQAGPFDPDQFGMEGKVAGNPRLTQDGIFCVSYLSQGETWLW
jgi:hypothetical protein